MIVSWAWIFQIFKKVGMKFDQIFLRTEWLEKFFVYYTVICLGNFYDVVIKWNMTAYYF